ncbi:MAG: PaaI family thioesterase [Myxococcales bacterium]
MNKPDAQAIQDFLFNLTKKADGTPRFLVEELSADYARVRMPARSSHLRPGDTVSGPVQMTLADTASWAQILHNLGFDAAPSVTSNLNISFLSRPMAGDLIAEARLLKLGRRLAVSEVRLFSEGRDKPVAHATVTYAVQLASELAKQKAEPKAP